MCNYLQAHLCLHNKSCVKFCNGFRQTGSFTAIFLFFCPEKFYLCNQVNKPDTELKNFCLLKIQSRRISARLYPFFFSHMYRWEVEARGRSYAFLPGGYP